MQEARGQVRQLVAGNVYLQEPAGGWKEVKASEERGRAPLARIPVGVELWFFFFFFFSLHEAQNYAPKMYHREFYSLLSRLLCPAQVRKVQSLRWAPASLPGGRTPLTDVTATWAGAVLAAGRSPPGGGPPPSQTTPPVRLLHRGRPWAPPAFFSRASLRDVAFELSSNPSGSEAL